MDFVFEILTIVLRVIGYGLVFRKCGVRPAWALVPLGNSLKMAKCADNEDAGSVWAISGVLLTGLMFAQTILGLSNETLTTGYMLATLLLLVFSLIRFIYYIRIYASMCQVFGKRKFWLIPWVLFEGLTAIIWGLSSRFQPNYGVQHKAVEASGVEAEFLEKGLTVNINKRTARKGLFGTKTMLQDVHFNIVPGKMVLLLGGSGAGKTTLINAVTGYEPADATVYLNGRDVYRDFRKVIYDIGMVPQQELIRSTDTVYRTLLDSAALRMPSTAGIEQRKKRVNEVMEIFGLMPIKNALISKQSGGQKKRISIATEYISNPSLFILDEPDSGLDGILARELMQKLHGISREGKIVIVVTHTPDRVIDLFDEVIVLAKDESRTGRLVFKGPVDEAKEFFDAPSMEQIVRTINRPEEGGLGRTDELLKKYNAMRKEAAVHA